MKSCPRCATVATGTSVKCRQCGALLVTPPVPLPMTPSPPFVRGPTPGPPATGPRTTGPAAEERFFAPATFTPIATPARERDAEKPTADKRGAPVVPILVVLVVVACGVGAYATLRPGSGGAPKTPVVLPPIDESRGLPDLADAVRIQAESARQRAFAAVGQASTGTSGAPLDAPTLRNQDPSLEWVTGDQSSTGPGVVSFSQSPDGVIIAVSAKSREVCAFGRWAPAAANRFVTMGNVGTCRAADAPAAGWAERGPTDGGSRYAPPDGY